VGGEEEGRVNTNDQLLRENETVSTRYVSVQYVHNGPIVISILEPLGSEKIQLPIKGMLICLMKIRRGRETFMPPMKMNGFDRMLQLSRGRSMDGPLPPMLSGVPGRRLSLTPSSNET